MTDRDEKAAVVASLELPRKLLRGEVAIETCRHAGHYAAADPDCLGCETRIECEWLYHHDEMAGLDERPLGAAREALRQAVLWVDARVHRAGHVPETCLCEACRWLGEARRLEDDVSARSTYRSTRRDRRG